MDPAFDHEQLHKDLRAMLENEEDWIAAMATVACEIFNRDPLVNWAGFYRVVAPGLLKVGPYQGSHGCLSIPFDRGVCGRAARERRTQRVDDVREVADHIACSSTTLSELVVPILDGDGSVHGVLDLDAETIAYFSEEDSQAMEQLAEWLGRRYFP
ncbi:MAG: diguanylate cyclase [Myxococcales bacterium]|nr:diguanylate cyclase [Myxococcales bacterium]|tara:strand:- start:125 stop:592 length:468 start_codon:yes stop_codon:yes gene_type:complete